MTPVCEGLGGRRATEPLVGAPWAGVWADNSRISIVPGRRAPRNFLVELPSFARRLSPFCDGRSELQLCNAETPRPSHCGSFRKAERVLPGFGRVEQLPDMQERRWWTIPVLDPRRAHSQRDGISWTCQRHINAQPASSRLMVLRCISASHQSRPSAAPSMLRHPHRSPFSHLPEDEGPVCTSPA